MSTVPGRRVARPAAAALAALLASSLLAACGSDEPAGGDPDGSGGSEASATPAAGSETPESSGGSDGSSTAPSAEPASTQGWRTEVWHDLQLEVPAGWTVGYAPVAQGGDVLECGVGPFGSDGPDGPDTTTPYVGRPGYGSDVCDGTGDVEAPEQDFVWFGSPLERGETEDDGRSVTTVEVDNETVTVGAAPDVAAAILESLTEVGEDANGCPAQPKPETRYPVEGFGDVRGVSVCVYADDEAGALSRTWTESLGARQADQLVRGVALGRRADCDPAPAGRSEQRVLLRATFDDDFGSKPLVRDYLVELGECSAVLDLSEGVIGTPRPVALSERILDAWDSNGVRAYVVGGSVPRDLASYFKPIMG
ncbi:hypothetical protein G7072_03025 [Nocardioides sp. HDW12B]|uniref:hypothetical protein n=1 Tax=Nocardioides sp. HDW12B TaxID=2714939 RepID=UPI00140974F3|nr:hypothetical protein [Nocardioides sp. HDW12B]QIK65449.1 hypothetical protein G7072_03025 [Nocardioides sp. HDW12B]